MPSRQLFAEGYYLDSKVIADDFASYCPAGADRTDPRLSPSRQGDLSSLPATIIHTAEYDPLRDEAIRYGELLLQAGVSATVTCHPGMIHLFYAFSRFIPKGGIALEAMEKSLGEILLGRRPV